MAQRSDPGLSRRAVLGGMGVVAAASTVKAAAPDARWPVMITSWEFGPGANEAGWPLLAQGRLADAVEAAINLVELAPNVADVGFGGNPNEVGETTLDAMFMWGPTHDVGAVGCLKRVKRAISVARAVQETTQHSLIVGDDATRFAVKAGFTEESLTNAASQDAYEKWVASGKVNPARMAEPIGRPVDPGGHDTIGTMAIDAEGRVCVGCSTNGRPQKIPGRVGDSPIAGAGAYCDNDVGAAIATGNGDVFMRFLPTYHAVELLRAGKSPEQAALAALMRIRDKGYQVDGGLIVLAKDGRHGAAKIGWADVPMTYSVRSAAGAETVRVRQLG